MMQIINGIVMGHQLAHEMIKQGCAHLGDQSPFSGKEVLLAAVNAGGGVYWKAYTVEGNEEHMEEVEQGAFEISDKAIPFVTMHSMADFIQFEPGTLLFNQKAAIEVLR